MKTPLALLLLVSILVPFGATPASDAIGPYVGKSNQSGQFTYSVLSSWGLAVAASKGSGIGKSLDTTLAAATTVFL